MPSLPPRRVEPALLMVLAGVAAALHIGKLAPAIPGPRESTLVQPGFLLSLVQLAGMTVGAVFGVVADMLGGCRRMTVGLVLLAIVNALGGLELGHRAVDAAGRRRGLRLPARRATGTDGAVVPTCRLG
jgi:MFS family permease